MQILLDVIVVSAVLLAGVVFTPVAVKRTPTDPTPRRAPSTRELASRPRYRH